jgi:hypothetical protein
MSKYTEKYEYKLTRTFPDGSVETCLMEVPWIEGKIARTHEDLAQKFNEWLDSCSYIGHNYINHRDRK